MSAEARGEGVRRRSFASQRRLCKDVAHGVRLEILVWPGSQPPPVINEVFDIRYRGVWKAESLRCRLDRTCYRRAFRLAVSFLYLTVDVSFVH